MNVTDRYQLDEMPNGLIAVELLGADAALLLTRKQARTLATKLRNHARPRDAGELAAYLNDDVDPLGWGE